MLTLKPGTKLTSAVCDTQVMVVKGSGDIDLRCGGVTMGDRGDGEPAEGFAEGCLMGKRYTNEAGDLELLCTKPGAGSLSVGDDLLGIKQAQALPSSD